MSQPVFHSTRVATRLVAALAVAPLLAVAPTALVGQVQPTQATRVTGTVSGDDGRPIEGALVTLVGTRFGGTTNATGRYVISGAPAGRFDLRVQRLGYRPAVQSIVIGTTPVTADVTLAAQPTSLSAIAVVGYTTQQRRDVSDAT
ncbi:MAG TPA: carboxypeptidase regulatory-like domain-containing protein, partial [Gemmatimonadaceae bacterium]|nr:carboxypeptidase regulatory-like domain-containing protein [Gemmatimonadaceae bacterium]